MHIDDAQSDDNGQDLTNYSFDSDGFGNRTCMANRGGVDWTKKIAFRYRHIKTLYNQFSLNPASVMNNEKMEIMLNVREQLNKYTKGWLDLIGQCLDIINRRFVK